MLLLDDLLLFPISGFKFIMRTLQRAAEEEYTDDAPLKERLLELQLSLENGDISETEYVQAEREILQQLREVQARRRELAGLPPEEQGPMTYSGK
jgi:cytochrome c-type biogenesis protein CcmH/NrfG